MEDLNLVVIKESLAKLIIDAGLDCVQVKYAVPEKIAKLFNVHRLDADPVGQAPEKNTDLFILKHQTDDSVAPPARKRKRMRGPIIKKFKLARYYANRFKRMELNSESRKAANICINSMATGGHEVVDKKELIRLWEVLGVSKSFLSHGTGALVRAGILSSADEVL